jgi:hypothetical protein
MKKVIFLGVLFLIISNCESNAQIKSISDKENVHFIGSRVTVYAKEKTTIRILNKDESVNQIVFDSTLNETKDVLIFFLKKEVEDLKLDYPNDIVLVVDLEGSGLYYIEVTNKQKFFYIK